MNILIVSSYLPYPLFSGGHIRLFNLIKQLSQKHKITLVCEKRDYQTASDVRKVEKFCKEVVTVPRRKQWTLFNIIKTAISPFPFLMVGHTSSAMKKMIEKMLKERTFKVIHVETFYVMQNLPLTSVPTVLVEHNVEYLVYRRFIQTVSFSLKPLLMLDIAKMKYWEERFWEDADKLIAVSEEEKRIMRREDVEVVPNGVDTQKFKMQNAELKIEKKEKRILFIGDFRWVQNRDSIEWILKDIWPKINSKLIRSTSLRLRGSDSRSSGQNSKLSARLWIVGKNIPDSVKRLSDGKSIVYDENASEDASVIYQQTDILLAPIRVGGGTSYKILEAMASGVPVITTSLGAQGIEAVSGRELLFADTTEEIADLTIKILKNQSLFTSIARSARKLIEEKYDWKIIAQKLESVYESMIQ